MRNIAPLAFAAVSGVLLWKLFATILLPVVAMALGLAGALVKFALIGAAVFAVYSMIKRRRETAEG